ncbi:MAG: hypothetical protein CSA66_06895 [Proteobacteria bacterium]|nr:MAG: hypothetical protein CSA66_06895 [Pseudomonadota bacterium]
MKASARSLALVFVAVALYACGSSAAPTKEQLAKQLTELSAALQSSDLDAAASHIMLPPDRSIDEMKPMLPRLLEKREISVEGVKLLIDKGQFGTLTEVFPDKGPKRAERVGANVEECYAFKLDDAEVMARWTGSEFKIFRLDDVGKLAPKE